MPFLEDNDYDYDDYHDYDDHYNCFGGGGVLAICLQCREKRINMLPEHSSNLSVYIQSYFLSSGYSKFEELLENCATTVTTLALFVHGLKKNAPVLVTLINSSNFAVGLVPRENIERHLAQRDRDG